MRVGPASRVAARRVAPQQISARYRGHGTDLAKVPEYQRHDADTGSPEAQVARLTGEKQIQKLDAGEYYMDESGVWKRK